MKSRNLRKKKSIPIGMLLEKLAATYFSTNECSIIGDVRLLPGSVRRHGLRACRANFSVASTSSAAFGTEREEANKKRSLISETPYKNGRRLTFPQTSAVSSARAGLTSLFGMGRGEHRLYSHPNKRFDIRDKTYKRNVQRMCQRKVFG